MSAPIPDTLMAYLDGELSPAEADAFERLLEQHPEWAQEVDEMRRVVAATRGLTVPPPSPRFWDGYWEEIDERLTKRWGFAFMAGGGLLVAALGTYKAWIWSTNPAVRTAVVLIVAGFLITFLGVVRGHLLERPRDRYRRIRR